MFRDIEAWAMIAAVLAITFASSTVLMLVAYWQLRERKRSNEVADIAARFEKVEQAVESLSVELERVGEVERFAAKLLAQQTRPIGAPEAPGRVITPH